MIYSKFEDIPVWQDARAFLKKTFDLIKSNEKLKRDFIFVDQLKRASLSIPLNIAEGFDRSSNTEFAHFLNIAKASAGEVRAILYLLKDCSYIDEKDFGIMKVEVEKISSHITNFRKYLLNHKSRRR